MLLAQSLVRRHLHSQNKYFVKVKDFVSTLFLLFGMLVMHKYTYAALHMICKFNIDSGQKRLNGLPAKSAADSVSQGGFPLGHQILKGSPFPGPLSGPPCRTPLPGKAPF